MWYPPRMTPLFGSLLRERLGYALSPGGAPATLWWLFKKLSRLEVYQVLASAVDPAFSDGNVKTSRFSFRSISTSAHIEMLGAGLRDQLEEHCGKGFDRLMSDGTIIYFLADNTRVACQLIISTGGQIRIDSPRGLIFDIGPRSAYLSYLFTHEGYRRIGAAQQLIGLVWKDLAQCGVERIVAHVAMTNVPSLNTFARSGWKRIGTFGTTTGARLVFAIGLSGHGVKVYSVAAKSHHGR